MASADQALPFITRASRALQVVLGVLGCPNLPHARLTADDGGAEAARRVGESGIGVLFTAQQGCGAAVGPLTGASIHAGHSWVTTRDALPVCIALGPGTLGGHQYSNVCWYTHGTAWYSFKVMVSRWWWCK